MERMFRLVRMPLLLLPMILWTLLWPLELITIVLIAVPVLFVAATLAYFIGFPFVFVRAAYSNEVKGVSMYRERWATIRKKTLEMPNEVDVAGGYRRVLAWGHNPKAAPQETDIIVGTANVFGVLLIGAVVFGFSWAALVMFALVVIWTVIDKAQSTGW